MPTNEEIVAALSQPFPEGQIKWVPKAGGKLAYITARHAMNRLDEVVGPGGWYDEYVTFGSDGVMCKLTVTLDDERVTKCGIGGAAGMSDADDDEKSAESSAFKRAAVKFGIGRYLYQNGVPKFCGDCPVPEAPGGPRATSPAQRPREAPRQPRYADEPRKFDNFKIPPPGKAVFAWAKSMEDRYRTQIIPGMDKAAEAIGCGRTFSKWDEKQVEEVCLRAIAYIKTLKSYGGEFDHIDTEGDVSSDVDDSGSPF